MHVTWTDACAPVPVFGGVPFLAVPYCYSYTDQRSCVHSIDMLHIDFWVDSYRGERVLRSIAPFFASHVPGWSFDQFTKLDLPACSRYQYFQSAIWGGGFHIAYGQYKSVDRVDHTVDVLPVLRVKFNPNKCARSPLFADLFSWIHGHCYDGMIVRFDYAVDVPCQLADLVVSSRKEPGLYKGTRYFGQRHHHGHVKIYDKSKEQADRGHSDLPDHPITRVEYTFVTGKPLGFDSICWLTRGPLPLPDQTELSPCALAYCRILRDLRASGGDVLQALEYIDRRTREKVKPYTIGSGVQLLEDTEILTRLLSQYCVVYNITYQSGGVNPVRFGPALCRYFDPVDDLEADDQVPFLDDDPVDQISIEELPF